MDDHNVANVSDLDWGVTYEFIVTGVNGVGDETPSDMKTATVGARPGMMLHFPACITFLLVLYY